MATPRIVILGGGFGGLTVATELSRRFGDGCEVILVDHQPTFRMGFRKAWLLVGRSAPGDGVRPREALAGLGVRYLQEEIVRILPAAREVETAGGTALKGDYLVVALGAEPRPDLVPGFNEAPHAYNLYEADSVLEAAARLEGFEGGRLLISILGLPFKCPPAPFEMAFLAAEFLEERGRRQAVDLAVTTPQPVSLPSAGPVGCQVVETALAGRGIAFLPKRQVERVGRDAVEFGAGPEAYDLLLGVPPHRPPAVVLESGLCGDGDWVRIDPPTLRTRFDRVFAIGDVNGIMMANGMPLPKAGVFAEAEGRVVAEEIAAELEGRPPEARFDGWGHCFIELGRGLASLVQGNFLATPEPQVEIAPPSRENLQRKLEWEDERLRAWFGG